VIQLLEYRHDGLLQVGKIHYPAQLVVQRSADVDVHLVGVSVQAGALVPLRHVGQAVRRLNVKALVDFHVS